MNKDTMLELLGRQPFARGFQERQFERLGELAKEVRFEKDRIIFREDEECSEFFLIVSGTVALEIAPPGWVFRVDTLGAGDEMGWSSLLLGHARQFQARVLQDTHVLVFQATDLLAMCEADTAFGYELMRRLLAVVAGRLQATRLQVMDTYWPAAKRAGN